MNDGENASASPEFTISTISFTLSPGSANPSPSPPHVSSREYEATVSSGALTVSGTASFTTDVDDKAITLDETNHAVSGAVSFTTNGTAGHVTFDAGTTALELGASTVDGNLVITAGDAITQSGALTVSGTSTFTSDVDDKDITLTHASNALVGGITFTNQTAGVNLADVSLTNTGGTTLSAGILAWGSMGTALINVFKLGSLK